MVYELSGEIDRLVREYTGPHLRSILVYTADDYDLQYVRDDVAEEYDDAEVELVVEELRLQTLEREYLDGLFEQKHGRIVSNVLTFADAVEINFLVDDGVGLSIAIDRDYCDTCGPFFEDLSNAFERHVAASDTAGGRVTEGA